ncbi:unnamed protein product [Didymodactylos carnosus]|uniref:Uncharacterized protein n=1 Tax=Didymodactylos carnosus TaxID=1234261 RepID=A0A8S2HSD0_9BILA|nr:unnamed protein product [Didymodactylos carnosus]CAF3677738.1 unnamed protein product [Didymodactylos carnosus]
MVQRNTVFNTTEYPVDVRLSAMKAFLKLEPNEQEAQTFIINLVNSDNIPRRIKSRVLGFVNQLCRENKYSKNIFFDIATELTKTHHPEQYNIDFYTLAFCSPLHVEQLLQLWEIRRLDQLRFSLSARLIKRHPQIVLKLLNNELEDKMKQQQNYDVLEFFKEKEEQFSALSKCQDALIYQHICQYVLDLLKKYPKPRREMPSFLSTNMRKYFETAPEQMIDLLKLLLRENGLISGHKYSHGYSREIQLNLPRSLSEKYYTQIFMILYEKMSDLNEVLNTFFENQKHKNFYSITTRRKYFFENIVQKQIGIDKFLKKLYSHASTDTLSRLEEFPQLTSPLSKYLLARKEKEEPVDAVDKLTYLKYDFLEQNFDEFVKLMKETNADVEQRAKNLSSLLKCSICTRQFEEKVLNLIEKRLTNEQLMVIENLIRSFSEFNDYFHLNVLIKYRTVFESIFAYAFKHQQRTWSTLQVIFSYASFLVGRFQQCSSKAIQTEILMFAGTLIKRCYESNLAQGEFTGSEQKVLKSSKVAQQILIDQLKDPLEKMMNKNAYSDIESLISCMFIEPWSVQFVDEFLERLFFTHLANKESMLTMFSIDTNASLIEIFLKDKNKRSERVIRLLELDIAYIYDSCVQKCLMLSKNTHYINFFIQDEKCLTLDKLKQLNGGKETKLMRFNDKKLPGFTTIDNLLLYANCLTHEQQLKVTNMLHNDYLEDDDISMYEKLNAINALKCLTTTHYLTLKWSEKVTADKTTTVSGEEQAEEVSTKDNARQIFGAQSFDNIVLCLPAGLDLFKSDLLKILHHLMEKLNSSNAKYVSDAMLVISRKITDKEFLDLYLKFIKSEQFPKLGITANKELLRILIEYRFDRTLIDYVLHPLWLSKPHQDIRVCCIAILIHFIETNFTNENMWAMLEQAAVSDEYGKVHDELLLNGGSPMKRRYRRKSPTSSQKIRQPEKRKMFVQRVQMKILDHPSLIICQKGWQLIDHEHCDQDQLVNKAVPICQTFDKIGNTLTQQAFARILTCCKMNSSYISRVIQLLNELMTNEKYKQIDRDQNALDDYHDLPVYHRIDDLISSIIADIKHYRNDDQIIQQMKQFSQDVLKYNKALAKRTGELLLNLVNSKNIKQDLIAIIEFFKQYLTNETYRTKVLDGLSRLVEDAPFIEELNIDQKLSLCQDLITSDDQSSYQTLLIFDYFTSHVLSEQSVNKDKCRELLRQVRASENMVVNEKAMSYKYKQNNTDQDNGEASVYEDSHDRQMDEDSSSISSSQMS